MSRPQLSLSVLRLVPMLWMCACGGFHTPEQSVAVGLALTSNGLPPRATKDNHVLVLSRALLSGTVLAARSDKQLELISMVSSEVSFTSRWVPLAEGPVARGDYQSVRIELTAFALEGTWDASPFHLEASELKPRQFELSCAWRVELGQSSSLSLICDPISWVAKVSEAGQKIELIDPKSGEAVSGLMDRVFQSFTAARDDNHDGVEDAVRP